MILEMIKTTQSLGDFDESILLGVLASVLSSGNILSVLLNETTQSNYYFQDIIKKGNLSLQKRSIIRLSVCRNGCLVFTGPYLDASRCSICNQRNKPTKNISIVYFPIGDRISRILHSPLIKLLNYPKTRKQPLSGFLEDI